MINKAGASNGNALARKAGIFSRRGGAASKTGRYRIGRLRKRQRTTVIGVSMDDDSVLVRCGTLPEHLAENGISMCTGFFAIPVVEQ